MADKRKVNSYIQSRREMSILSSKINELNAQIDKLKESRIRADYNARKAKDDVVSRIKELTTGVSDIPYGTYLKGKKIWFFYGKENKLVSGTILYVYDRSHLDGCQHIAVMSNEIYSRSTVANIFDYKVFFIGDELTDEKKKAYEEISYLSEILNGNHRFDDDEEDYEEDYEEESEEEDYIDDFLKHLFED